MAGATTNRYVGSADACHRWLVWWSTVVFRVDCRSVFSPFLVWYDALSQPRALSASAPGMSLVVAWVDAGEVWAVAGIETCVEACVISRVTTGANARVEPTPEYEPKS